MALGWVLVAGDLVSGSWFLSCGFFLGVPRFIGLLIQERISACWSLKAFLAFFPCVCSGHCASDYEAQMAWDRVDGTA